MSKTSTGATKQVAKSAADKSAETEKQREQKIYNARKLEVLKREEVNLGKIILMKSSENFYKIFGRSVILLQYVVAPRTGNEYRRYVDRDYVGKSKVGVISIRTSSIEKFKKNFLNLDEEYSIESEDDDFITLDLGKTYTKKEIMDMFERDRNELKMINATIHPNNVAPNVYLKIEEISTAITNIVKKMETTERELFGRELYDISTRMLAAYVGWCDKTIELEDAKKQLFKLIVEFKARMIVANNISSAMKKRQRIYLGMAMAELKDLIVKDMKKKK